MFLLLSPALLLQGQTNFTRIYGPADRDVAIPPAPGTLGVYDSAALTEVAAHIQAVGASPWTDLQATGQITYPGEKNSQTDNATLSILGWEDFRLDVTTPKGLRSTRIAHRAGVIEEANGRKVILPPATAALGLVPFPRVRAEDLSGGKTSVIDDGTATVEGQALHRITLVYPFRTSSKAQTAPVSSAQTGKNLAVDLYFDPSSHLLLKSVDVILLSGAGNQKFLRCTTYGDYRQVDGSLVPYSYTQSLNGQVLWTLQLNEVSLGVGLKQSAFFF